VTGNGPTVQGCWQRMRIDDDHGRAQRDGAGWMHPGDLLTNDIKSRFILAKIHIIPAASPSSSLNLLAVLCVCVYTHMYIYYICIYARYFGCHTPS
jgi:hypothetical protein